ncbi:GH36-type glycosyl hydrolase domain-containing protein [Paenibacillus spongiae]|uniref:Glycosyl transferase family 36 n=1 Tax=Paenibacillus spongiae TaxID=2909671 RepID=A0ABY5SFC2_9BACL|nr:glucoamylase family protein [Paenibacillus spongiae]UVI32676.1 glycosyl transferase family 36 [Paenibacillus spongiae]
MVSYNEQLCQKAREQALEYIPAQHKKVARTLLGVFDEDMNRLQSFVRLLQESPPGCSQNAEEWLLDNAEFLEEQAYGIKDELIDLDLSRYPVLRSKNGTMLRVESVSGSYLEAADDIFNEQTFVSYMNAYQEVSVLSLAETWSLPLMLRISMIRQLAEIMAMVRERREACMEVDRLLKRLDSAAMNPDTVRGALEEAGQQAPISGPWIVHLIGHLRERAEDSSAVHEWLTCRLENGTDDLNRIITYERQLQAGYQTKAGHLITGLRLVERLDWSELLGRISLVEQTLLQDGTGIYPMLDGSSRDQIRKRVERAARRMHVPESLVAKQADKLAQDVQAMQAVQAQNKAAKVSEDVLERGAGAPEPLPREAFLAYYVSEPAGLKKLQQALHTCSSPRQLRGAAFSSQAAGTYLSLLTVLTVLAVVIFAAWIGSGMGYTLAGGLVVLVALLLPASEWAVTWLHYAIGCVTRPRPLLRYDFSAGIPSDAVTMVVIPIIWSSIEDVQETVDRLELHYLANRDAHLQFAILGDYKDAHEAVMPGDELLFEGAKKRIGALNAAYPSEGKPIFHLFMRRRQHNSSEGVYMGWERKRGKLVEFVELLKGSTATSYHYRSANDTELADIRYVITLDADTQLPIGSAQRMIGTMHLPYNRPRLNQSRTRITEGYGMLQPRIAMSYEGAMQSRLTKLWSGIPGIDPYAFAVSDPYQDALGHGIFTGKGIFDVDTFAKLLCDRIPENRVLSHDLLEGGFLRTGLLSDIELIDDHPAKFSTYQKRQHRWVRGDWQLLCWLLPKVCDRQGTPQPVDLSVVSRWQMIDNLRRSLLPVAYFVLLALGLTVLPGSPGRWLTLILLSFLLPVIRQLAEAPRGAWQTRHLTASLSHVLVSFWTLPFQSVMLADAIGRTLYRLFISKRKLLEWVSSADIERHNRRSGYPAMLGMPGGYTLIAAFALLVTLQDNAGWRLTGWALCLVWALAPLCARWLDQPIVQEERAIAPGNKEKLHRLARRIWQFYADYAGPADHYLPPDNVQLDPPNGVAHRTSPTNIGFLMTAILSARDFGFIDTPELIDRLEKTVGTIERMEKWNGNLYNWYDTVTLEPLPPRYVSTVDSGNFVASLIAVKQGLLDWMGTAFAGEAAPIRGLANAEFAVELTHGRAQAAEFPQAYLKKRADNLVARIESLIVGTDFRPLYDDKAKLFVLGYNGDSNRRDDILYDLLASEARQTSFVAIALGQISVSHWFRLGRSVIKQGTHATLLSWSGTMFEYLMPWLLMRTYKDTIWDTTYQGVVMRQIDYARERGVPYGISESGYYAFDHQMNYQYQAFGVPGLGYKRGLEEDLVVAPYAAVMSLPFAMEQGMDALKDMEDIGALGEYGFYEAIDFTPERLPEGQHFMMVRSYMAHHQGMSLLTLANLLLPEKMYDRFHSDKRVQAAELLLKERIPARHAYVKRRIPIRTMPLRTSAWQPEPVREFTGADTLTPEVGVYSNGSYMTMVTNSGGGFSLYEGLAVTRWREDPIADNWGSFLYIRDVVEDRLWSPSYQPCHVSSPEQRVQFALDKATFSRVDGVIRTKMDIGVSTESNAEIRRISLTNTGNVERLMEVTTYQEIVLTSQIADESHQAFSKLFVETDYAAEHELLLARRRPRDDGERPVWAFHKLLVGGGSVGPAEFETSRSRFIGRGNKLSRPAGIDARLIGMVGAVADPAFVMRRRVTIAPGETLQLFAVTGAGYSKEELLETARLLSQPQQAEQAFQLAWTHTQIEQRHLQITAADALAFQQLAGRALYTAPFPRERTAGILENRKGQSGLWAHGVSGERPVVMVRIDDAVGLPFVVKLFQGHEYLRRIGLSIDLVVLNESEEGYQQDLQENLRRARERISGQQDGRPGKITVVPASQLTEEERILFAAVSRVTLRADGPSLKAQLRISQPDEQPSGKVVELRSRRKAALPDEAIEMADSISAAQVTESKDAAARSEAIGHREGMDGLQFFNGWGGFTADGREYRISVKHGHYLPAPWINVMANPRFGCLVSELHTGYTWWRNSRECKLTPWSNDPALDRPGEACFLRDEQTGAYWPFATERGSEVPAYQLSHGRGYTRFYHETHGLQQEMTVYVPVDDPVKIIRLRLRNTTPSERRLSLTYYAEWVLGVRREGSAPYIVSEWDEANGIMTARNHYQETFRDATAFLAFGSPAAGECSYTGDRLEFLGRDGSMDSPAAMGRTRLSNKTGPMYDSCGAVRTELALEPDAERTVYILLGCEASQDDAVGLVSKYRQNEACEQAYDKLRQYWDGILDQIQVTTPSPEMDLLINNWLLYQTLACRMWARTAFYQAGGAFGFRDQLQDSLALLHSRPEMTRQQIILHASHQYEEGDVQHWWHEETERGIRTRFSDDLLWLPYAVSRYIEHTGDEELLDELAPYLYSGPLDVHERYEPTVLSGNEGPIYEHCIRVLERSMQFGEHGLALIGGGDWNDGMSRVGVEGRGESVWLGWFLIDVLQRFAKICEKRGDAELASRYRSVCEKLAAAQDKHGWDGQWYRRAYHDGGVWLGTAQAAECRIDAIAQSWSVLSGGAPRDKTVTAMQSFDRELVDRSYSIIALLTPPFDQSDPSPGYIQGYPPGIRENGGQYTHGVLWSIAAWCELGDGDKAFELFHMLNPITHTSTPSEVRRYAAEPYVMAADVYTSSPNKGHAGWTWYTGASGWMYQVGLEWILGIRRRDDRLMIRPSIPREWPGFTMKYRYGSAEYRISVENPNKKSSGLTRLVIDGNEADANVLAAASASQEGPFVPLLDDGRVHEIHMTL